MAYSLPLFRLAGLRSESNAEVAVGPLTLPVKALTLNADVSWHGKLVTGGCDEGCNAYVFAEVQDPVTRLALPGQADALPLMDVDGLRLPLEWGRTSNATVGGRRTTAALVGKSVVIRLFFRSSTLYGLMID